jgi:hypothetical protein
MTIASLPICSHRYNASANNGETKDVPNGIAAKHGSIERKVA